MRLLKYHDLYFFFSSRRRHTRFDCDWSSDVCSSDLFLVVHRSEGILPSANHFTRSNSLGSMNHEEAVHFLLAGKMVLSVDMAARLLMLNFHRRFGLPLHSPEKSIIRANSLRFLVLHSVNN